MQLIETPNYTIVIFSEVTEELLSITKDYNESDLILVPLDGVEAKYFSPERFLVKNHNQSFTNHMMWEGLLDDEEQLNYIKKCAEKFHASGKQMIIEEYDFQEDEPFYDYSK